MRHCEILLPFGLPLPALAPDLLRSLQAPALATLLSKAGPPQRHASDPFARCLPHEAWLAQRTGVPAARDNSPQQAVVRMHDLAQTAQSGTWFLLHPVHIHIARDHLVLTDQRRLSISDAESRTLFDIAQAACESAGLELRHGSAGTWFLRADAWSGLQTATPDAACGHNVDIWMPKGPGERNWRKLQNEIQMEWHDHPINQARETRREPVINSLWIWGGADAPASKPTNTVLDGSAGFTAFSSGETCQVVLDALSEPALAEDWGQWLERMQALEASWFAPLLDAIKGGAVEKATLRLTHHADLREFSLGKTALWKFWSKPSFAGLQP